MKKNYRVDITVRIVPEDSNFPVKDLTFSIGDNKIGGYRSFVRLEASNKVSRAVERLQREIFGEEDI